MRKNGTSITDLEVFIPLLISLIILFLIFIFTSYIYNEESTEISLSRENVLSLMEDKLEFCEIQREEIDSNNGRFWMVCNGRPYYAEFVDGRMVDDMNGWSFLREQPDVFNELTKDNCDFLYSKNNALTFYCDNKKAKIYDFDSDTFRLKNGKDKAFVDLISEEITVIYGCNPLESEELLIGGKRALSVKILCQNHEGIINFNLEKKTYSTPTIVDNPDIAFPIDEKASLTYELLNICSLDYISMKGNKYNLNILCYGSEENLVFEYDLDSGISNIVFSRKDFENVFPAIKRLILPFISSNADPEYLTSKDDISNIHDFYSYGGRVLVIKYDKEHSVTSDMYLKDEGFNEHE